MAQYQFYVKHLLKLLHYFLKLQQEKRLLGVLGAQLGGNGGLVVGKHRKLGAGGVILRQRHNLLKQPAALVVVEIHGRQRLERPLQPFPHVAGQVGFRE